MKRMVWNAVSRRKVEAVKDACSFASVANKLSTSVAVTFFGSKELEATADLLGLKKFFSVAPVIRGIAKFHSLEPLRNGLIRCRTYSYQSSWIEMGVQFSGSENEDLDQNDSDDQDSSSLSKGSNSTSSADEDDPSEEKRDFFQLLQETAITRTKKFQVRAARKTVKVMMKRVNRVKKKV